MCDGRYDVCMAVCVMVYVSQEIEGGKNYYLLPCPLLPSSELYVPGDEFIATYGRTIQ